MDRKKFKILLDVIMLFVYVFLMFGIELSGFMHEILGIVICILFVMHLCVNRKTIVAISKGVLTKKVSRKVKILTTLDVLLFIIMPVSIVSGILISKDLFNFSFGMNVVLIHQLSSYAGFIIMLMHIGTHAGYILTFFKIKNKQGQRIFKMGLAICSIVIIIVGILVSNETITNINGSSFAIKESSFETNEIIPIKSKTESVTNTEETTNDVIVPIEVKDTEELPTLEEYLSKLTCDGCNKGCSLLEIRCSDGIKQQEEAIEEYNAIYK